MPEGSHWRGPRPVSLLQQVRRRFSIPTFRHFPALADAPERWRTQIGGFDPATPYAEALINYHNHAAMFMFFVVFTVLHVVRK
ncbi:hypothetical protein X943_001898 [Babesia divergens]|uniref:Uncharacterized protein n=1 Tax=Babesia divergens TaxID=32595 RepID=A0AAD9G769_BABDI|nr:hypothetical protein X943_001898 [Babesia divergens]